MIGGTKSLRPMASHRAQLPTPGAATQLIPAACVRRDEFFAALASILNA